jgi:hypothetical protein
VVIAHAFGIVEVTEGTVAGARIELTSTNLVSTSTAKRVNELTRAFEVTDEVLTYEVAMAYGEHPLKGHLAAELHRVG